MSKIQKVIKETDRALSIEQERAQARAQERSTLREQKRIEEKAIQDTKPKAKLDVDDDAW